MSETTVSVKIPEPLLHDASQQAKSSGMTLEDWLLVIAAERVRDEQVAERFFRHKLPQDLAARRMCEILNKAPDNPPDPGDELPEGYVASRTG